MAVMQAYRLWHSSPMSADSFPAATHGLGTVVCWRHTSLLQPEWPLRTHVTGLSSQMAQSVVPLSVRLPGIPVFALKESCVTDWIDGISPDTNVPCVSQIAQLIVVADRVCDWQDCQTVD